MLTMMNDTEFEANVKEFCKKQSEQLYGKILDMARISPMNDRQFEQFAKDTKQYVRETLDVVATVMIQYLKEDN